MLENQFITFSASRLLGVSSPTPFPVMLKASNTARDFIDIFVKGDVTAITVVKADGTEVSESLQTSTDDYKMVRLNNLINQANIADGEVFHLKYGTLIPEFSNPLVRVPVDPEWAYIRYSCDEDAFGFPFSLVNTDNQYFGLSLYLPIRLHSPQNVQDDKTYVKADGEVVTLYAKYYKEWEAETEYLSADIHDKIVAALSCDEVYINGKRVTKSDKYQVDWKNYDLDCDGVTKLAKATFKVREHITQRNSNY